MIKKFLLLLPFVLLIVLAPAIHGPLLLDDTLHIDPILQWLATRADTYNLIFGNNSGPIGRPVSILSFVLNAITSGTLIWPMKLTNLILHFITALCLYKLFLLLFNRDNNLRQNAQIASLTAAVLWLLLPQHVSTIFYVIQRMTILASLFAVIACWLFVLARKQIEKNDDNGFLLLAASVAVAFVSVLSKESGLLIPLYFLLIELVYFHPNATNPRPQIIAWGFRLGVIYPCVIIAAYLAINPGFVMDGYIDRPFSMPERAMTQISVVADYFASTFIPMVRSAGIYNDDFPIAQSLGSREILLVLFGAALISLAIALRKKYPSFTAGIGLFFIGHLLESSIFSLEIYFAHRNYLPSMGLVLALFGLVAGILNSYPESAASFKKILPFGLAALFLTYAAIDYSRATLWSNNNALLTHAQIHHPGSSRMRSELLLEALYAKRVDIALEQAELAMRTAPDNEKRTIQLWRILAYCYAQQPQPSAELSALYNMPADRITMATSTALGYVSAAAEVNACPGLDRKRLGILTSQWATNTIQPTDSPWVWKAHFASARLIASSGDLEGGLKQATRAFENSGYNFDIGILAYQLANSLEDQKAAAEVMAKLKHQKANYTDEQQKKLRALRNR